MKILGFEITVRRAQRSRFATTPKEQEAIDSFFHKVLPSAHSNEMIMTWIGRNPEHGGMVVIPWNLLNRLTWDLVNEMRGDKNNALYTAVEVTQNGAKET